MEESLEEFLRDIKPYALGAPYSSLKRQRLFCLERVFVAIDDTCTPSITNFAIFFDSHLFFPIQKK